MAEKKMATINNNGTLQRNFDMDRLTDPQKENIHITSAVPLTEDEYNRIASIFERIVEKPVGQIILIVDPNLLTGVRIQSDSYYFEMSGQKTLRELQVLLNNEY